ncbi:GntR family transcriptional regulator [Pararhizobium haloflavum]|uniref:GntR family transcriptional regulator n=1 Tax=Pararhizobium haloflavum TaxID=2037914 RepID=UPI000C191EFB|nr:FCD domain-containing protein [Pararhizobium haloflavum]
MFGRKSTDTDTVVRLLAEQVRRDISFGVLPPDTRLKIEDLRQRYGGSAHSFREALTHLANEGLVEANAQRGFRVASATEADLEDITRLRAEIECLGLGWAIRHGDVDWEGRLLAAHHAYGRATDRTAGKISDFALEWDETGRHFHAALLSACRSPRLIGFQEKLYYQSRRFRLAALAEGRIDLDLHRAACATIVSATLARQMEAATAALATHILSAIQA